MYRLLFFVLAFVGVTLGASAQDLEPKEKITRLSFNSFAVGEKIMDKHEYNEYLRLNCPIAHAQYNSGKKLAKTGYGLLGGGVFGVGAGCAAMLIGETEGALMGGLMLTLVGGLLIEGSIPCLAIGYVKQAKSCRTYNARCASPTLSYQVGVSGVGLRLNF